MGERTRSVSCLHHQVSSQNLREKFPASVNRQIDELCAGGEAGTEDPDLNDLTDIPYITIDNDNSMDLDQAMHIAPVNTKSGDRVDKKTTTLAHLPRRLLPHRLNYIARRGGGDR